MVSFYLFIPVKYDSRALSRSAIREMNICDWTVTSGLRQIRKTMY